MPGIPQSKGLNGTERFPMRLEILSWQSEACAVALKFLTGGEEHTKGLVNSNSVVNRYFPGSESSPRNTGWCRSGAVQWQFGRFGGVYWTNVLIWRS